LNKVCRKANAVIWSLGFWPSSGADFTPTSEQSSPPQTCYPSWTTSRPFYTPATDAGRFRELYHSDLHARDGIMCGGAELSKLCLASNWAYVFENAGHI